ncbi:MAG: hypothetical protein ACTHJJ_08585 [Intrasporangium sp.]|uniref:hypothetical protein n=1 Tax=Intrasporangium sp. TaxID=1925024 RepID=UPI003F823623
MFTPRHAIVAGVVLVALAAALASGGHGFWIIFPLFWVLGGPGRWARCQRRQEGRREDITAPDPTRDRHEAFPGSH